MKMLDLCNENNLPFEYAWPWGQQQNPGMRWFAIRIEGNTLVTNHLTKNNKKGEEVSISIDPSNVHHERNDDYFLIEKES